MKFFIEHVDYSPQMMAKPQRMSSVDTPRSEVRLCNQVVTGQH
jgi:hypothetical protein